MTLKILLLALPSALLLTALAGAGDPPAASLTAKPAAPEEGVLVGPTTREKVEAAPEWVQAEVDAKPDAGAAQGLGTVEPGAEVTVFLGTWCGDSRREVPRLWKALDAEGDAVPFQIRYVGVDHDKKQPADLLKENGVRYLPTFIVRRGGHEVGRIVETSPHGVEQDLLALLTGKASGVLTTRQDLAPAPPHPQG
ncbi:MAG TPA: thioredoxin family protein [Thermoanaerobaculia bacterium]|nr:thioredoxin family protein [Thermoanaerobaculia bacterium]